MSETAASFALQAEQPVRGVSLGSGDIRALSPVLLGLCVTVDVVVSATPRAVRKVPLPRALIFLRRSARLEIVISDAIASIG